MLQPSGPRGLATSEQLIGALLAGAVCAMVLGALAPVLGLAIRPWPIALVSITAASGAALWLGRFRAPAGDDVRSVTTAALLVMAASAGYVLWLAWPSLYPATSGPDLVHHLSLVHFIQQRGTLPSSLFGAYLGEMTSYPPGSHVLAAVASTRVDNDPYDFRRAISAWVGSSSMRFAIVADWTAVPADARDRMRILATFGPALVVERTDEGGTCIDETPPIDQVGR